MVRRAALVIGILMALAVSACSGSKPEPVSYQIDMTEYAFNPSTIEVKVGQQVSLDLVNNGTLAHELMIGREVKMVDNRRAPRSAIL
jgi:plastocyanin